MSSITFGTLAALVAEGNVSALRCFLDNKHINVDERDDNGQTLLMIACQVGQLAVVQELLSQGADVNAEDYDNWSALLNAAKENHASIVSELLERNANIEHRDVGGWTALMWACYKGCTETAHILLERGAIANTHDLNHISCLVWAAGRGYTEIVRHLLAHGAKVNSGDKYGTTPLVWASRKGYLDIVEELLQASANVDTAGMFSWTPLIVAAKGNHIEVVNLLLEYKPNVNAVDMDGCTALTIACKEGFADIAVALLKSGAYVNLQDRSGDTNLIHATKAGHIAVVEALIKKYADVDIQGADRKTALYWAAEKGYVDIARTLLKANPNLEIATKDGDTALMKATRNRNLEVVQMLVDKKARVSATDKKGDTALHIAMRARSKGIVEVLLRNPKNSQLLYRPNRAGETPYNIDTSHQKSILSQIFGARRLNTNEDSENMLGYDLYGSALADILSEPSLSMPISVGLYAKWGSGKSFLLNKLTEEMRSFAIQWLEPSLEFSWLLLLVLTLFTVLFGVCLSLATRYWIIGITIGLCFFFFIYSAVGFVKCASTRYDWNWANAIGVYVSERLNSLKVLLQVVFCHPPAQRKDLTTLPVRFLFADQTKVSSAGGDMSLAQIVIALYVAIEDELGFFATRLYRAFKPKPVSSPTWKWRRLCCIPNFVVFLLVILCAVVALVLTVVYGPLRNHMKDDFIGDDDDNKTVGVAVGPILITLACIVGVVILSNMYTLIRMMVALVVSHQRRIQHNLAHFESPRVDGYIETLKTEVDTMNSLVKCLDAFIGQQTRLVIIVDGLDSCEQEKVLRVLDAVHLLFSDPNAPFITVLAIDPHIIIKAIEANICRVLNNTSIRGHDYLQNIVHLPFYLQNSGLRRVKASQQAAMQQAKRNPSYWVEESQGERPLPSARKSSISSMSIPDAFRKGRKGNQKLKASESVASSISNLHRMMTGAQDLTKVLLTDDYFSDVNPRSMRRLMNIVYITGRLLKAFNIDFNWYHLASWVNITEQWPYRTSWMILYYELNDADLEDTTPLKMIFEKIKTVFPTSREVEPMLDLDHDEKKFEVFLSFHSGSLLISDLKVFLPFTINLDPYIRKSIQEKQNYTELLMPGVKSPSTHHASSLHPQSQGVPSTAHILAPPTSWMTPQANESLEHHWMQSQPRPGWQQGFLQRGLVPPHHTPSGSIAQPSYVNPWLQGMTWENSIATTPLPPALKVGTIDMVVPKNQKLSNLPVEGVINLLSTIDGIDKSKIKAYNASLLQNNIHGRVLLTCDLNELKEVMKMSFGDWELFRLLILALRQQELQESLADQQATADKMGTTTHTQTPALSRSERSSMKRSQKLSNPSEDMHDSKGRETASAPLSRANTSEVIEKSNEACFTQRNRPSVSAPLEKQVTMEESMICGALETLNEEAHEDALEERRTLERGGDATLAGMVMPSPLSPIFSDPEEQSLDDHPHINQIANTIIGSFANPGEINVMYLKNLHGTPSHARLSPISASAPDIEWAISSNKQVILSPTDFSPASSNSMLADIGMSAPPSIASSPPTKTLIKVVSLDSEPVSPSKKSLQGLDERKQHQHRPPIIHKPSGNAITTTPDICNIALPVISRPQQRDKPIRSVTLNGEIPTGCTLPVKQRSSSLISHADSQKGVKKPRMGYRKQSERLNSDSSDSLNSDASEKSRSSHVAFKRDTAEIAKRFAKHRPVSLTKHASDADSSEDEQTPLVSPVQSTRSILSTGGSTSSGRVSPTSPRKKPPPVTFHQTSGSSQVRSPLERQFSLDVPCTDESAMLVTSPDNETPTDENASQRAVHRRQISLALAQSQPLTLLSSPSSDGGGSGFSGPNSPNSQESSVSLQMNSSETIL